MSSDTRSRPAASGEDAVRALQGVRSAFLDTKPDEERQHILAVTGRMAQELEHWACRYPSIRRERIVPTSLTMAAAAPRDSVNALLGAARVTLWIFALDDLFDESLMPGKSLLRAAANFARAAHGCEVNQPDEMTSCLYDVRNFLAAFPSFPLLDRQWASALCGTIDAMVREYHWREAYQERGELPSYAEYVANGSYSIGAPPYLWTTFVTSSDPSLMRVLSKLKRLEPVSSACIRLANDLRSHDRELAEGNLNAITIVSQAFMARNLTAEKARVAAEGTIRGDVYARLVQLEHLRDLVRSDTGQPESIMTDIARFACDFYVRHDFNDFNASYGLRSGQQATQSSL